MKLRTLLLSAFLLIGTSTLLAQEIQIIPQPRSMEVHSGGFILDNQTQIIYSAELEDQALLLQDMLRNATLYEMPVSKATKKTPKNSISLSLDNEIANEEGYTLDVTADQITLKGKSSAAVFYATQTLLQLLPAEIYSDRAQRSVANWNIPAVSIEDEPKMAWRGMMLDVSRYFMSKEYVLHYIDMMAMYKLNTLHLHLVDDSGWRLESKKYPLLTQIGGFRGEGERRTGGFYTQEDIKEMVAYGLLRGVNIVPELEFPAHILSGVVAYPWLSCREEELKVQEQHYISPDLLCMGKESTFKFLEDIITETCELFPAQYIHIGGDEAVYTYWETCPHCQKVKEEQGLEKSQELQAYLTNWVAKMSAKFNRTIVGWDEILERGEITEPVVSMIWRNLGNTKHALDLGHKVVLAPASHTYFDFPESNLPSEIKAAGWMPPISIEKCYNFEVEQYEGNPNVLGIHGCLWTDQFIHGTILQELTLLDENRSESYVDFLTLPRLLALSENSWTLTKDKDYEDFLVRLSSHFERLDYAGFNYRTPTPEIVSTKKVDGGYLVELSTVVEGATIHYVTNGAHPTKYDPEYTSPVKVAQLSDLRSIAVSPSGKVSVPTYFFDDYSKYKEYGTFAQKISYSDLKEGDNLVTVDLTGKISGNGKFVITLVPLTDQMDVMVGDVQINKRDEQSALVSISSRLEEKPISGTVEISEWQAGTPYSALIGLTTTSSHKGNFALFIQKVE
ncbi:MAG: family 20 glycosylhydrolase [Rikenellaceae bacterium]